MVLSVKTLVVSVEVLIDTSFVAMLLRSGVVAVASAFCAVPALRALPLFSGFTETLLDAEVGEAGVVVELFTDGLGVAGDAVNIEMKQNANDLRERKSIKESVMVA